MARRLRIAVLAQGSYAPLDGAPPPEHRELEALVRRHLPVATAALFAEPRPSADRRELAWYSDLAGQPVALVALGLVEQAAARERLAMRLTAVAGLAERLRAEAPTEAARLEAALRYPGDEVVYVVGGEPVLVFWGHQVPGRPPLGPPVPPGVAAAPPSVRAETTQAPEVPVAPHRGGVRRFGLATLALLTLGTLGYSSWQALGWGWWWPPWGPEYAELLADAEAAGAVLRADAAERAQALEARVAGCLADAALATARTEGARLEGRMTALAEQLRAALGECPPPPRLIVISPEAVASGNLKFLEGTWRLHQRGPGGELEAVRTFSGESSSGDSTSLVADLEFDGKGRGQRIIKLSDGDRCVAAASATFRDGRLHLSANRSDCRSGSRGFVTMSLICTPEAPPSPARCLEHEPGFHDEDVWLVRVE